VQVKQRNLQDKAVKLAMEKLESAELETQLEKVLAAKLDQGLQELLQKSGISNAGSSAGSAD
jgi:hypothetical protein